VNIVDIIITNFFFFKVSMRETVKVRAGKFCHFKILRLTEFSDDFDDIKHKRFNATFTQQSN